ncbi:hypothetical protein YT1_0350 [Rhodococcus ruber]|nr:hypothetical protein YT1_0350 [Rhodococcus ruber]
MCFRSGAPIFLRSRQRDHHDELGHGLFELRTLHVCAAEAKAAVAMVLGGQGPHPDLPSGYRRCRRRCGRLPGE